MKRLNKIIIMGFITMCFLFVPKNVMAADTIVCNNEAAKFTCEYNLPSSGLLPSDAKEFAAYFIGGLVGGITTKATHDEMQFKYNICTDGKGGMKADIYTWNTGDYELNIANFIESPAYFYEGDDYTARCPDAYIRVDNNYGILEDSKIKIRKTKGNVNSPCFHCTVYRVQADMINYNGNPFYTDPTSFSSTSFDDCNAILGTEEYSLGWLIKKFLLYFKVLIPIIVLTLSVVEFVKAIIVNDDDTLKKAQKRLIIRLVIAIVLFLVPTIVDLLLDVFGFTASNCNL